MHYAEQVLAIWLHGCQYPPSISATTLPKAVAWNKLISSNTDKVFDKIF